VVADPQPVTRIGVRIALEDRYAVRVVGEASEPAAAAELAETLQPAAVVIDPGSQGVSMNLSAWDRLRDMPPRIVAFVSRTSQAPGAALAGADSCLLKASDPVLLHETLVRTVRGERVWLPGTPRAPGDPYGEHGPEHIDRLVRQGDPTVRERQVLALLLENCTDVEISERLVVSRNTVKSHVRSILRKLDLPDRRALLRFMTMPLPVGAPGGLALGTVDSAALRTRA
jgi:DNA-binding NarL/FixJ family response regulator